MHTKDIEKYYLAGLLVTVGVFLFFVFRPFLTTLILGTALSVVLYPLYGWIKYRIARGISWLASLLTVILFVIIVCGPVFAIGALVFHQSKDLYSTAATGQGFGPFIDRAGVAIDGLLPAGFSIHASERASDLVAFVSNNVDNFFSATLTTIASFLLLVLSIFYFLKDGAYFSRSLMIISPLLDENNAFVFARLKQSINGVVKGYLLIALAQGLLMGVGLALFGVPHAALWGVFAGIASMVPTIGTALVAIPAVLYLLAVGDGGSALGLGIWSALLVGTVDNLLNPYLVGSKIDVPPLLILFSVLGGVVLLGPVGILIGPVSVSLLLALISIYRAGLTS